MFRRLIALFVCLTFVLSTCPAVFAQEFSVNDLPVPGTMVSVSPSFEPALIKGLTVHQDNPFLFDFIVDPGQSKYSKAVLKDESERMIKYFFAALTIPDKDIWVNLSPYEKDRMIPVTLGQTAMGRDLLAQDYMLKQLTASLIYPQKALGKTFWDKVYSRAKEMYGTTQIPVNTFNKVWIVPQKAGVYEHGQTAFIVSGHLKVMLEEDYLSLSKHQGQAGDMFNKEQQKNVSPSTSPNELGLNAKAPQVNNLTHNVASQIIKQIILPEIEKEINEGKNFATLRQIFYAQVLAVWFKRNLKQALLSQVYANKGTVKGIDQNDAKTNREIYRQYLKAYKKGVFNYIQEDINPLTQETLPRKYFSGGFGEIEDMALISEPPLSSAALAKVRDNDIDFAVMAAGPKEAAVIRASTRRWGRLLVATAAAAMSLNISSMMPAAAQAQTQPNQQPASSASSTKPVPITLPSPEEYIDPVFKAKSEYFEFPKAAPLKLKKGDRIILKINLSNDGPINARVQFLPVGGDEGSAEGYLEKIKLNPGEQEITVIASKTEDIRRLVIHYGEYDKKGPLGGDMEASLLLVSAVINNNPAPVQTVPIVLPPAQDFNSPEFQAKSEYLDFKEKPLPLNKGEQLTFTVDVSGVESPFEGRLQLLPVKGDENSSNGTLEDPIKLKPGKQTFTVTVPQSGNIIRIVLHYGVNDSTGPIGGNMDAKVSFISIDRTINGPPSPATSGEPITLPPAQDFNSPEFQAKSEYFKFEEKPLPLEKGEQLTFTVDVSGVESPFEGRLQLLPVKGDENSSDGTLEDPIKLKPGKQIFTVTVPQSGNIIRIVLHYGVNDSTGPIGGNMDAEVSIESIERSNGPDQAMTAKQIAGRVIGATALIGLGVALPTVFHRTGNNQHSDAVLIANSISEKSSDKGVNRVSTHFSPGQNFNGETSDRAALAAPNGGIDLSQQDEALHVEKDANGGVKVTVDRALIARIAREGMNEVDPVIIDEQPADIRSLFGAGTSVKTPGPFPV